jgi:hypothetical protein
MKRDLLEVEECLDFADLQRIRAKAPIAFVVL